MADSPARTPGQSSRDLNGSKFSSARLKECLEAVREATDWDRKRRDRTPYRGLGVAVASHGSGSYAFPGSNHS